MRIGLGANVVCSERLNATPVAVAKQAPAAGSGCACACAVERGDYREPSPASLMPNFLAVISGRVLACPLASNRQTSRILTSRVDLPRSQPALTKASSSPPSPPPHSTVRDEQTS